MTVTDPTPALPSIRYPAELPITARHDELLATLAAHQVVVVAGETGSGKSTQLPKLCLELGRGADGRLIGHTQPRRVAARTIAERVASELDVELGSTVGYSVRFTDRVSADTRVRVMTDGILLAEIQRDRMLSRYDTLIIDEAHERSLNIDFLLGYLRQLLPRRPDLKLVITSATIDTERFASHFCRADGTPAPIVTVEGRTYPVETRYRPFGEEPDDDRDQTQAVVDAVTELWREGPGDVLVFLSGEREIHDTADALRRLNRPDLEVLPLYARLSAAEQRRIWEPHRGRRVVLATNVAETSITVPGVRYVVDAGTARISRYSRRLKVQRLPIEAVSQASANQRAGRCGRVSAGICIRLYSEADFADRPEFTEPEILRTNLASVILQMATLGLGDIGGFPFVEPPDTRSINDGIALLEELGALRPDAATPADGLTKLGRRLARLPVDPRLGRMVLEAERLNCVREVMVIVAAMSIQDPRERPTDKQQAAAEMHRRFAGDGSDFLALVKLWDYLRTQQRELSSNQFRKLCRTEFLNYLRVREWQDLFSQLRRIAGDLGIHSSTTAGHPDHVHRALLSGLLSQIGMRDGESKEFRGARGARFVIGSGSTLAAKPPRWVMAGELVETNRLWGRVTARIQPEWAEQLAGPLVKRSWGEPWWDRERTAVLCHEKATLFGLPIIAQRAVQYHRIDPDGARELFIRHALVAGEWETPLTVFEENRALVAEVAALQERLRRHLSVDDDALVRFYDSRVGDDVWSPREFDRWWRVARMENPRALTLTREDLVGTDTGGLEDFPEHWPVGPVELPLTYELDPGSDTDGVTVHIPVAILNQVGASGFDWQVPGLRDELITELIRSLPKEQRRQVSPVNEFASDAIAALGAASAHTPDRLLVEALASHLATAVPSLRIRPGDFQLDRLPRHLRLTYSIETVDGRLLATGSDLGELQQRLRGANRAAIAACFTGFERTGLTDWPGGTIEMSLTTTVTYATPPPPGGPHATASIHRAGTGVGSATRSPHRSEATVTGAQPTRDQPEQGSRRRGRRRGRRRDESGKPGLTAEVVGYPALLDDGGSVSLRMLTTPIAQRRAMRGGVRRLLIVTVASPRRTIERELTAGGRLAIARLGRFTAEELVADATTAAFDRAIDEAGGIVWDEESFRDLQHQARGELPGIASEIGRLADQIVMLAVDTAKRIDKLTTADIRQSRRDASEHFLRLVRPGFISAVGAARLADQLRYVEALDWRMDRIGSDPGRDAKHTTAIRSLEAELAEIRASRPADRPTNDLVAIEVMIEELRVSLFAQAVGARLQVSETRVLKALVEARAVV